MYRPLAVTGWLVTLAVLPVTVTAVVQLAASFDTWMVKSRVLKVVLSPPAPACRTVNDWIAFVEPRSTCRNFVAAVEHHLSLLPPETLPLTAFSGPSVVAHAAEP